jgi:tetratricopeptide (TPR) repeat protein
MGHLQSISLSLLLSTTVVISGPVLAVQQLPSAVQDPPYGLALYEYFQDRMLPAMTEIQAGQFRGTLSAQGDEAQLLLGSLYFSYGLVDDSQTIFDELLQRSSDPALRDRVWYNLARVNFQRSSTQQASELLQRIEAALPEPHETRRRHIESALLIASDRLDDAQRVISSMDKNAALRIYADYNLALRRLALDDDSGADSMRQIGDIESKQRDIESLADQANLTLGLHRFAQKSYSAALDRLALVRLDGPVASDALLATGWIHQRNNDLERAIAYWRRLLDLGRNDAASREAAFTIGYTLEQAGRVQRAVRAYEQAARDFDAQKLALSAVAESIARGELVNSLDSPQTGPLTADPTPTLAQPMREALRGLLGSSQFQRALDQLRDLREIEAALLGWSERIPVLALMQRERLQNFENKAPEILQSADLRRIEQLARQRDEMAAQLQSIAQDNDFLALASEDERDYLEQIEASARLIESIGDARDLQEQAQQIELLRGLLHYTLATDLPRRLWRARHALNQLDTELSVARAAAATLRDASTSQRDQLTRMQAQIDAERAKIDQQLQHTRDLLQAQRKTIEELALQHLNEQLQQITTFRLNTQYGLSRLYDRLTSERPGAQ